jgi:hypothetical protein
VRLNAQLKVQDYFIPFNQQCLAAEDGDLGSGGPLLLPDQHRLITAGKEGRVYVINTTAMGHYHTIAKPCNNLKLTWACHLRAAYKVVCLCSRARVQHAKRACYE